MPKWKRALYYLAPALSVLTLILYWTYFALRIRFVLSAQDQERNTFPLAWVFIGIELAVAIPVFLQSFWSIFILKKRNRPKYRLIGNNVPTVDVFITCCGEEDDLVLDTARAACGKHRVRYNLAETSTDIHRYRLPCGSFPCHSP